MYIKILNQNLISKFYIKILYQNFISKFYIKILYQNFISKFYIKFWLFIWYFLFRLCVCTWCSCWLWLSCVFYSLVIWWFLPGYSSASYRQPLLSCIYRYIPLIMYIPLIIIYRYIPLIMYIPLISCRVALFVIFMVANCMAYKYYMWPIYYLCERLPLVVMWKLAFYPLELSLLTINV